MLLKKNRSGYIELAHMIEITLFYIDNILKPIMFEISEFESFFEVSVIT